LAENDDPSKKRKPPAKRKPKDGKSQSPFSKPKTQHISRKRGR
jgi:hypothetical protein